MNIRLLNVATAALLLASAATAPATKTAQSEETKAAQAQSGANEKKICKRLPTSQTRMVARTCHTKAEWKQIEASAY